jgi:hypothetical protein
MKKKNENENRGIRVRFLNKIGKENTISKFDRKEKRKPRPSLDFRT